MPHLRFMAPLAAGLLVGATSLDAGASRAIVVFNILEVGSNIVIEASGSLTGLPSTPNVFGCDPSTIDTGGALLCTGNGSASNPSWGITGPADFSPLTPFSKDADATSGIKVALWGGLSDFTIDSSYVFGVPIVSSATFNNLSFADLGITENSLIGTWTINGTSESIELYAGPSADPASVPGPLPLFGAAAAFGWTRKLRRRISTSAHRF